MKLFDIFKPKPDKFLLLLVDQTRTTVKGLELLKIYLTRRSKEAARDLNSTEKQADEIRRIVIEELMKTFVTPFDREDIFSLSREIDDVLDYANTTVDEMEILEVSPTPYMARMASLLFEAAHKILEFPRFRRLGVNLLRSAVFGHDLQKIVDDPAFGIKKQGVNLIQPPRSDPQSIPEVFRTQDLLQGPLLRGDRRLRR